MEVETVFPRGTKENNGKESDKKEDNWGYKIWSKYIIDIDVYDFISLV